MNPLKKGREPHMPCPCAACRHHLRGSGVRAALVCGRTGLLLNGAPVWEDVTHLRPAAWICQWWRQLCSH